MNHVLRVALFDESVFGEINDQPEYMFRALRMVVIGGLAFGVGIWSRSRDAAQSQEFMELAFIFLAGIATILMSWIIWAGFAWLLGSKLFGGSAGYRALLRILGLSYLPICVWLTVNLPYGGYFSIGGHLWLLAAGITAIKYTEKFAWWKAIISGAIGWLWALVVLPKYLLFA